jgi:hypothetical protein
MLSLVYLQHAAYITNTQYIMLQLQKYRRSGSLHTRSRNSKAAELNANSLVAVTAATAQVGM